MMTFIKKKRKKEEKKKQAATVYVVFWASFSINPENAPEHDLVIITRPH